MDNLGTGATNDYGDPTTETVRSKISTWLTGIVEEVRRKSPGSLQKWVEPAAASCANDSGPTENILIDNSHPSATTKYPPEPDDDRNLQKLLGKFNFQKTSKKYISNEVVDCIGTEQEWTRSGIPILRNFNKSRINEIYSKCKIIANKSESSQRDSEFMEELKDITEIDNGEKEQSSETETVIHNNDKNENETEEIPRSFGQFKNETEEIPRSFEQFKNDIKLGLIGRSSTLWLKEDEPNTSVPINTSSPRNIQNDKLSTIFRSCSEQQDDDDDDDTTNNFNVDYSLNTRSQSFIHVQSTNQNICDDSTNPEKDDDNHDPKNQDTVSSSLPSFLDKSGRQSGFTLKNNIDLSYEIERRKNVLMRDNSYQSDSSHCSSVDSLLESRKPDPEAILINLGFGPIDSEDVISRIPKRFLKPSQVKGIDTEAFLRRQQIANNIHDHSVLGYRGLIGNPDIPPSTIVAKIMERFELNEISRGGDGGGGSVLDINMNRPQSAPPNSMENYKF